VGRLRRGRSLPLRAHSIGFTAYPAEGHREYSEATAQALDLETKKLLEERLEHVQQLLRDKRSLLDCIAAVLLA
jgi:ATP-dependent Zn protease